MSRRSTLDFKRIYIILIFNLLTHLYRIFILYLIFYRKKIYITKFYKRLKIFINMRFYNVLLKNRIN